MPRIIDLLAVLAVAVVLLLPKPSVVAQPALSAEPIELDRVSDLQGERFRAPDDVEPALALADSFLSLMRPDWTLTTLSTHMGRRDYRVHLLAATARAERLEAAEAVASAREVEKLCEDAAAQPRCPEGTTTKIGLIRQAMQVLLDGKIDPAKDPQGARHAVSKILHSSRFVVPVRLGKPSTAAPTSPPAKPEGPPKAEGTPEPEKK